MSSGDDRIFFGERLVGDGVGKGLTFTVGEGGGNVTLRIYNATLETELHSPITQLETVCPPKWERDNYSVRESYHPVLSLAWCRF